MSNEKIRLLFVGEKPIKASPSVTLANALIPYGFTSEFAWNSDCKSVLEWLKLVHRTDIIIVVSYEGPITYRIRQLALARALFRPVVRWWVGSDVLYCLDSNINKKQTYLLEKVLDSNVAVAKHLVMELKSIDVEAEFIPSVLSDENSYKLYVSQKFNNGILVYLPTNRQEFYGYSIVKDAVEKFPSLIFYIIGDEEHSLQMYENVRSLGWVDDLSDVWDHIGCLLRVTKHDGMPRMVLDALRKNKYVIFSFPFEGCWLADSIASVSCCLKNYSKITSPNINGQEAYKKIMTPLPSSKYSTFLKNTLDLCKKDIKKAVVSAIFAFLLTVRDKLKII